MSNLIRTREEQLLAKVAGKEIDINNMRPPAGTGTTEQLLLDIADRIDECEESIPQGTIEITKNGEYDITQYASADVNIEGITVNESYDISEGTLTKGNIALEGDVAAHIPDGVTTIGNDAFGDNKIITTVVMPNTVTTLENGAPWLSGRGCFYGCINLKRIILSSALTKIGNFAFGACNGLTSITIPDSVTSIGEDAFYGCTSLTAIVIPDSVTSMGIGAFNGCTSLVSIIIPDSVTSIGEDAFNGCTSLTDIYYTGTQAEWGQITMGEGAIPETATIHYEYIPE